MGQMAEIFGKCDDTVTVTGEYECAECGHRQTFEKGAAFPKDHHPGRPWVLYLATGTLPSTAPDLRTSFPRSGRTMLGGYVWLARLADKARARKAGTSGEYEAYCPVSLGFLDRLHVPRQDFEARINSDQTDEELVAFLDTRVSDTDRETANRWVLEANAEDLREQDAEEGRAG